MFCTSGRHVNKLHVLMNFLYWIINDVGMRVRNFFYFCHCTIIQVGSPKKKHVFRCRCCWRKVPLSSRYPGVVRGVVLETPSGRARNVTRKWIDVKKTIKILISNTKATKIETQWHYAGGESCPGGKSNLRGTPGKGHIQPSLGFNPRPAHLELVQRIMDGLRALLKSLPFQPSGSLTDFNHLKNRHWMKTMKIVTISRFVKQPLSQTAKFLPGQNRKCLKPFQESRTKQYVT